MRCAPAGMTCFGFTVINMLPILSRLMAAKTAGVPVPDAWGFDFGVPSRGIQVSVAPACTKNTLLLVRSFLAVGTANAAFYRAMGVPERKIFVLPYSVDNDRFIKAAKLTAATRLSPEAVRYTR